jgi:hypothetical protein
MRLRFTRSWNQPIRHDTSAELSDRPFVTREMSSMQIASTVLRSRHRNDANLSCIAIEQTILLRKTDL